MKVITDVMEALEKKGLTAREAYPGDPMPNITKVCATVSLERLELTARKATVLVTVLVPMAQGGGLCQEWAVTAAQAMESLGALCVQEECCFHGYAQAYYVRVLGTFCGGAVMAQWADTADFTVTLGSNTVANPVSFQAEQAVDQVTGTPLSTAVWSFRLEEEYGRGEAPPPAPEEPFSITVRRSGSTETYTECGWTALQLENTATGLRLVRKGVAKSRSVIVLG